jgi:metal-sulfur cluster biosynthetic enzyme
VNACIEPSTVETALRAVIDPELGIDVVALGLVYGVRIDEGGRVAVDLTMTTAACPMGELIAEQARAALAAIPGVTSSEVQLVWDPPWTPERMQPEARRALGWGEQEGAW